MEELCHAYFFENREKSGNQSGAGKSNLDMVIEEHKHKMPQRYIMVPQDTIQENTGKPQAPLPHSHDLTRAKEGVINLSI